MFALLIVYVVALPAFGFLPATAVFFLVLLAWLGEFSWPVQEEELKKYLPLATKMGIRK